MKKLITLFLLILAIHSWAQGTADTLRIKDIGLDLLQVPTNPAFIIMNTSPAEVVEPGSLPEFYTTIQNASNNLSAFPNNYGF